MDKESRGGFAQKGRLQWQQVGVFCKTGGGGKDKTKSRMMQSSVRVSAKKNRNGRSATGRRVPAGTIRDVNQWLIRVAVPREKEGRFWIPLNSKGGWRGRTEFVLGKGGSSFRGNAAFKNYLFADFQRKFSLLSGFRFLPNTPSLGQQSPTPNLYPFSPPSFKVSARGDWVADLIKCVPDLCTMRFSLYEIILLPRGIIKKRYLRY